MGEREKGRESEHLCLQARLRVRELMRKSSGQGTTQQTKHIDRFQTKKKLLENWNENSRNSKISPMASNNITTSDTLDMYKELRLVHC